MFFFRESSRVVFIPFVPASGNYAGIDDTNLFSSLRNAGDAVSIFVSLGKRFLEYNRAAVDKKIMQLLSGVQVNIRVRRTYTILLTFTLMVSSTL